MKREMLGAIFTTLIARALSKMRRSDLNEDAGGWLVIASIAGDPFEFRHFIVFAKTRAACVLAVRKQVGDGIDLECTAPVDSQHLARRSMKPGDICQIGGKRLIKLTLKKRQ